MRPRDAHVTGWRQIAALVGLIAALCLVFDMGRVIPVWSILIAFWGLLQIGRRSIVPPATPRSSYSTAVHRRNRP